MRAGLSDSFGASLHRLPRSLASQIYVHVAAVTVVTGAAKAKPRTARTLQRTARSRTCGRSGA